MTRAASQHSTLKLLPPQALIKTGEVDHADWNYHFLLGYIQRQRFKLIRSLLRGHHFPRMLEIGYGSGVFMPTLAQHCTELCGIDPHPRHEQVQKTLQKFGVNTELASGSAMNMPYEDGSFGAVVAVSALEFIPNLDAACREIRRVLTPGGVFVMVTPGHSPVVDWGLRLLTKKNPDQDFGNRRENILPSVFNHFQLEKRLDRPHLIHHAVRLYTALRLRAPDRRIFPAYSPQTGRRVA